MNGKALFKTTHLWLLFVLVALGGGCESASKVVTAPYDSEYHQSLVALQAYHLDFIDEFTAHDANAFDRNLVERACSDGNAEFDSALSYVAQTGGDETRHSSVNLAYDVFRNNCDVLSRGRLFSPVASVELKGELTKNYSDAITAECTRSNAPSNCQ